MRGLQPLRPLTPLKSLNPNRIIGNVMGGNIKRDKKSRNEKAIPGKKCFECGRVFKEGEDWYYWYHGDQDDRICEACAKKTKHIDTAYRGMNVFQTGNWRK